MKSHNLRVLRDNGFCVPKFIVIQNQEDIRLDEFEENINSFAVRSSFSGEDGRDMSFAGQFQTILDVKRSDVSEATETVMEAVEVDEYRNAMGDIEGDASNGKMKVIVQEMVDAELSGVMFTVDPLGILNQMVLVVGEGLGNNIVEGKKDVTSYYFNKEDSLYFWEQQGDSPKLKKEILMELFKTGGEIEELFKIPCDIEFAIKNNKVYILQARPITTLNYAATIVLDNSNIVESYPGINLPTTTTFAKEVYYRVFKSCVYLITKDKHIVDKLEPYIKEMVTSSNGRMYYNINNWYYLLKLLPMSRKIIPVWQNMLGVTKNYVPRAGVKITYWDKLKVCINFISLMHTTPKKMEELNKYFEENLGEYRKKVEDADSIDVYINVFNKLMDDIGDRWGITLMNDMYTFVYTALAGKNKEAIKEINGLESMLPLKSLADLKEILNKYDDNSKEFKERLDEYILRYGDRSLEELKLETKTFATNPESLITYIKKEDMFIVQSEEVNIKDNFFSKRAKIGMRNREASRLNRTRAFGLARKILLSIGEILEETDLIDEGRDIFYLEINEIQDISRKGIGKEKEVEEVEQYYRNIISHRKELYEKYKLLPDFNRVVYADKVINREYQNINGKDIVVNHCDLQGTPCSEGVVEGEVLVLKQSDLVADTKGKILVTTSTDPGWIFLMQGAEGIISEKGSLLSHTAIVSRELKKPSIVGIVSATELFKNGDKIRMNGGTGIIERL